MKDINFVYDSIIIGGGVIGASVARYLSRYKGKFLVIEKHNDCGEETSSRNSAIVHSGYDPIPGTQKAKFNVLGNKMMGQVCEDLNVEFLRIGSITVAFSKEEDATLLSLLERAKENNVEAELLTQEQLRKIEPNISPLATSGLLCKSAGIVNPFTLNIKFMENAMDNGVELHLNEEVTNITKRVDFYEVFTNLGNVYRTKTIVNAAGLYSDKVLSFVEKPEFEIEPRKGEYFVLDHFNTSFVKHTLFMCPTKVGKGILVSPTTSFNYILGPSNDLTNKEDYMTNTEILNSVKEGAFKLIPSIPLQENIRQFSGIRANSSTHDFVIGESKINKGFFNCAAIMSPGLASSPAIGEYVSDLIKNELNLEINPNFNPKVRKSSSLKTLGKDKYNELIKENPQYGKLICRCERVSEGEIVDSIHRNCGARSVKGVKKRTRSGFGRCQGTFCQEDVVKILARELNISLDEVNYDDLGTNILVETRKGQ